MRTALFLILLVLSCSAAQALTLSQAIEENAFLKETSGKLSVSLARLASDQDGLAKTALLTEDETGLRIINGNPLVEVLVESKYSANIASLASKMAAMGGNIVGVYPAYNTITLSASLSTLAEIAEIQEVVSVEPVIRPISNIGSVDNIADYSMLTNQIRNNLSLDGTGIRIGVLSDSYDVLGNASQNVLSGDLPGTGNPNGYTTPVTVLEDASEDGLDEGRAMLQLIHDIAPGAQLYFHTAFNGKADFAQGFTDLGNAGCDIIVDDVSYFSEAFFQDDIVSQSIDNEFAKGKYVFTAATNSARNGIADWFRPIYTNEKKLHRFNSGKDHLEVTMQPGSRMYAMLHWNEPSSGTLGSGSSTDLDLYISDDSGNVVAQSSNKQGCYDDERSGNPFEISYISVSSNETAKNYRLSIQSFCGETTGKRMQILLLTRGNVTFDTELNGTSMIGHAFADKAVSCAAINATLVNDWRNGTVSELTPESFSSFGGTLTIYYDDNGNLLDAPEQRFKPDVMSPDASNTTLANFAPFYGTSAAAPHAAAFTALMLQKDKTFSVSDYYDMLRVSSIPPTNSSTDPVIGYGMIDAERMNSMMTAFAGTSPAFPTITASCNDGGFIIPGGRVLAYTPGTGDPLEARNATFTIFAEPGNELEDVIVNGVSVGKVSSYTFENATGNNQTIQAVFHYTEGSEGGGCTVGSGSGYSLELVLLFLGAMGILFRRRFSGKL